MKVTVSKAESSLLGPELVTLNNSLKKWAFSTDLLDTASKVNSLLEQYSALKSHFSHCNHFVHVGIGGSSLGPEAILKAFPASDLNCTFSFFNNADPELWHEIGHSIQASRTLFYIVSKSGKTIETLAALNLITDFLKNQGIKHPEKHLLLCTDPFVGPLRKLAEKEHFLSLDIPSAVGGRYSVLTAVGLFPAYFAGLDIVALLEGANSTILTHQQDIVRLSKEILAQKDRGVTQTVFMPYSSYLREFSSWFVQLWSESLGKKHNRKNHTVHEGLTPIAAYGATDQHSQMQLFMDGPRDKFFLFFGLNNYRQSGNFLTKNPLSEDFLLFKNQSMASLLKAELLGTLQATEERLLPWAFFELDQLNEKTLGQLFAFFMALTAFTGEMLDIDPFDQPGVELGKVYAYEWFKKLDGEGKDLPLSSWLDQRSLRP